jgi:hypothetical protein
MKPSQLPTKHTPTVLMHFLVAMGLLIIFFITYRFYYGNETVYDILIWNILYLSVYVSSAAFRRYEIGRIVYFIISLPAEAILFIAPVVKSVSAIIVVYDLLIIFFMIIFVIVPHKLFNVHSSFMWAAYWILTATSIVVTNVGDKLITFWHRIHEPSNDEADFHSALSLKILNAERAKLLVFFLYFIFLLIFNSYSFGGTDFFDISKKIRALGMDTVILQSFATFIAFDAALSYYKQLQKAKTAC